MRLAAQTEGTSYSSAASEADERVEYEEFSPEEIERMLRHARLLGTGSFGKVYASTHLGTAVAVKILKRTDRLDELKAEIEITRARPHPNVIQFLGACTRAKKPHMNTLVLVMELMDNDMERLLADDTVELSLFARMKMAYEAALGLAWLHFSFKHAILHRDFATKNLFVKRKGDGWQVKVADFGLAKSVDGNSLTRNPGDGKKRPPGTPLTQAPEVMKNQAFGRPADVYSFGMVLWEILTRKPLFEGWENWCSYEEFVSRVTGGYRHQIPRDAPRRIAALIERCWRDDPVRRPTMMAVVGELEVALVEIAISDPDGQAFWKSRLMTHDNRTFRDEIEWPEFAQQLYRHLNLNMPREEKSGNRASKAPELGYLDVNVKIDSNIKRLDDTSDDVLDDDGPPRRGSAKRAARRRSQILGQDITVRESLISRSPEEKSIAAAVGSPSRPPPSNAVLNFRCLRRLLCGETRQTVYIEQFGELLEWFGPMHRILDDSEASEVSTFLDRIRLVLRQRWFHGPVDSHTAASIVSDGEIGSFLVRYSNQPGAFTIVVNTEDGAKHIRLARDDEGKFVVSGMSFSSLSALVERVGPALSPPLTSSAPGSRYQSLFD